MPDHKRKLLVCMIVLGMAVMSCRLSRDFPVSSTSFNVIMCTIRGGLWTVESESGFSWCDTGNRKPEQTSTAGAAEGVEQEGDPPSAAVTDQHNDQNDNPNSEIISAPSVTASTVTYQGTTSIATTWVGYWGGQVIMDEITIHIDKNGAVSGAILSIWESGRSDPIAWEEGMCVTEVTVTVTADLSGQLTETKQTIEVEFTQAQEIFRSSCPSGPETLTGSWTTTADLTLSADKISGTTEDGFTFEAFKQ